jgi:hypothetical protein
VAGARRGFAAEAPARQVLIEAVIAAFLVALLYLASRRANRLGGAAIAAWAAV